MNTSRERFLRQLERCVQHQKEDITLPDPPRSDEHIVESSAFVPLEEMGNGESMHCDASAVWGLQPPDRTAPPPVDCTGGWYL